MVREGLTEDTEQKSEGGREGEEHMAIWYTMFQAKGLARGPSVEEGRTCFVLAEQLGELPANGGRSEKGGWGQLGLGLLSN